MSFFHATIALHFISLVLCIPFGYVQYRLRNMILLALLVPVAVLHTLLLTGFFTWGTHVSGISPWKCAFRKGVYVYSAQGAEILSSMVVIRLWMTTFGYLPSTGKQVERFERTAVIVCLVLAMLPASIASIPQIISQDYVSDLPRLNKCSSGYIKSWQVFTSGAAFSAPTALAALLALGAISWRLCFLIYHRKTLVSATQSREAMRNAMFTLLRVIACFLCVGAVHIYYILADFLVIYQTSGTSLGKSTNDNHGNQFGHFMLSIWGIMLFLIFNTSRQSLWVLRTSWKVSIYSARNSKYQDDLDDDHVYAGTPPTSNEYATESTSHSPITFPLSYSNTKTSVSSEISTPPLMSKPAYATSTAAPVQPTLLPTPGVPTVARCKRDRCMNQRGHSIDWTVAESNAALRRPCAGEMIRTVGPSVFPRRPSDTDHYSVVNR
ncbi:hypothetical protein BDF19DRAFT_39721 [Syncephalis fuscata]|nr:hypothetical protein BDF19DRAFT_39721 [Syncephalis fuscata]